MADPKLITVAPYYDAATFSREQDYGNFFSVCAEDFYFNSATRSIALGRLRREIRNNPYLAGLVNKFPEAVGFSNLRSRTPDNKYNDLKNLFWHRQSKLASVAGDSLRMIEEIIWRELLIAGEVFILLLANGKVQLIPSEFCGSPFYITSQLGLVNGEVNGIQYNENGLPTAYRFGRMTASGMIGYDTQEPIDARYVIHIFHKDRVQMGRGLPWLLPSLRPAHDLYEITRAKTKQIKDANSLVGVIEKENAAQFLNGLAPADPQADGTPTPASPDDAADQPTKSATKIELRSGTFVGLEPGEKIHLLTSAYNASDYKELIMLMLHAISTPVGLPVELWFSGLGDVNYSGFKGLGTQWNARRQYLISLIEDRFLNRYHFWRVSKAAKEGELPPNPVGDDDLIEWAFRRTSILDEEKEAKANQTKLMSGEASLAEIWEKSGLYPDEVFEHRRQLWIQLQIASGVLDANGDHAAVKVPQEFLLRGLLPGEAPLSSKATSEPVVEPKDPAGPPADTSETQTQE